MALDLKQKPLSAFAGAVMAGAAVLSVVPDSTPAHADEPPRTEATMPAPNVQAPPLILAATTTPEFNPALVHDAHGEAQDWSLENPGIAVAVKLGTESQITPLQIRDVLTGEFSGAGVEELAFFYEQNDTPSHGVAYYYTGQSDGPFLLNQARPAARNAAQQYLFQQGNPALSYNFDE